MDRPLQDQNPDSQNLTQLQSECSEEQMEELGGDEDPCQASDQEADRQDPHGAQSQTGRLDLDHGEKNTPEWDKRVLFVQILCLDATS